MRQCTSITTASLMSAAIGYYLSILTSSDDGNLEPALQQVGRFFSPCTSSPVPAVKRKHVLLGVMSNPSNDVLRQQIREWSARFPSHRAAVDVVFVYGTSFHNSTEAPAKALDQIGRERDRHDDFFFVDGREKLPHVGVVTEKSGFWWRTVAERMPDYRFYCKSDDDTLVHLDHLTAVVDELERTMSGRLIYMGHTKWRAWDVDHRFQACGGGWGFAQKTKEDLQDPTMCPHAAGPYPYMSGGFVCMSRPLALLMGRDAAFGRFLEVAKSRNTHGHRCHHPMECAGQPVASHMWHHEDAGIGFNTYHAVVRANASAAIVPVPAHFNDPGIIERSSPLAAGDAYWSSRAVFVHGIKDGRLYEEAKRRWTLNMPRQAEAAQCGRCAPPVSQGGCSWDWARLPCPRPPWHEKQPGRWCTVVPDDHYTCCFWPTLPKPLSDATLEALQDVPARGVRVERLRDKIRKLMQRDAAKREPTCVRPACEPLDGPPYGNEFHKVLVGSSMLERRGHMRYNASAQTDRHFQQRRVYPR